MHFCRHYERQKKQQGALPVRITLWGTLERASKRDSQGVSLLAILAKKSKKNEALSGALGSLLGGGARPAPSAECKHVWK